MTGSRALQHHGPARSADAMIPPDLTLPDLLAPGLDLVFVGINPSLYSAERGQYFARPSNRFWAVLNQSGLVPEPLGPADGARLLGFGVGLTDIVKRPTHDAAELTAAEFAAGCSILREKLLRYAPHAVCFVGKLAWQQYRRAEPGGAARTGSARAAETPSRTRQTVPFGEQDARIGEGVVFVMPSTSGLVNHLHAERLRCVEAIRAFLGR